jgi:hypothetical protein
MSDIIQSTTQQFLDIYDITNNFVIMKDGTVSTIITVDAMNFGLLAEEEQDAIMYAYAGLLNSLNYSIQIIIHSQTKDVTSYLKVLQEQELTAENETMRRRIRMYREFVGNLIHERNVLDKKFYVIIPATALEMGFLATSSILPGSKAFDISTIERSLIIEKAKNLLDPKRDHIIAQFARIGLFSRQLTTQEIIQLFYIRYNPEAIEGQQIGESTSYSTPLVKASVQENFMNAAQATPFPTAEPQVTIAPTTPQPYVPQFAETVATPQPVTEMDAVQPPAFEPTLPEPAAPQPPVIPALYAAAPLAMPASTVPEFTAPIQPTHLEPVPEIHITSNPDLLNMPDTPPTPAVPQPPTSPLGSPTLQQIEAFTPLEQPTTPAAPDATTEAAMQADLNAALQSLGTVPVSPLNPTQTPSVQPLDDLPPLPEI